MNKPQPPGPSGRRPPARRPLVRPRSERSPADIAIIGLSCRFPGASNTEEFWRNLHDGLESISFYSPEDLAASGHDLPQKVLDWRQLSKLKSTYTDTLLEQINPKTIEGLFAADLAFLQDFYRRINENGHNLVRAQCPHCEGQFELELGGLGGAGATP